MRLYANNDFAIDYYFCIVKNIKMETKYTVKNFRKFNHEGAAVRFSPITILTGSNSSGKSSIVKSLILFEKFLSNVKRHYDSTGQYAPNQYDLNFSDPVLGLGRYKSSLHKNSKVGDVMTFEYSVDSRLLGEEMYVEYSFIGDNQDKLDNGRLKDVRIWNANRELLLHLNYDQPMPALMSQALPTLRQAFLSFTLYTIQCQCYRTLKYIDLINNSKKVAKYPEKVEEYNSYLFDIEKLSSLINVKSLERYTSWIVENGFGGLPNKFPFSVQDMPQIKDMANTESLLPFRETLREHIDSDCDESTFEIRWKNTIEAIVIDALGNILGYGSQNQIIDKEYFHDIVGLYHMDVLGMLDDNDSIKPIRLFVKYLSEVLKELLIPSFVTNVKYIGSSRIALKRLYSLDDSSNDFGELFRMFLKYEKKSQEHFEIFRYIPGEFMQKWLRKFGICHKIDIRNNADGQGIEVRLYSDKEDVDGHLLADEGYGITQMLALLLNIEVAILTAPLYEHGKGHGEFIDNLRKESRLSPEPQYMPRTITIEEPEVHLHPKYQSLIADMLLEAYKLYNIHFIVETHSEYLIRRSQVLVAQMGFQSNAEADESSPFRTIYVPDNDRPYNLFYRKDGKFAESFGPGFFDEASRLMFEIL